MRLLSCTLTMSQIHYIPFLAMINLFCVWIQSFLSFFDDLGYSQRLSQWRGVCFVISTSCYAFSLLWPHWTIWSHLIFVCRCSNSLVAISLHTLCWVFTLFFHLILMKRGKFKQIWMVIWFTLIMWSLSWIYHGILQSFLFLK